MTNSDAPTPEERVQRLAVLLAEDHIQHTVDAPIDAAAHEFRMALQTATAGTASEDTVSGFVRHVYLHGVRLARDLSDKEALAEAIYLLDRGYHEPNSDGYQGAKLDAAEHGPGAIQHVLNRLAATIKVQERGAYLRWVLATGVESLDDPTRLAMAAVMQKRLAALSRLRPDHERIRTIVKYSVPHLAPFTISSERPLRFQISKHSAKRREYISSTVTMLCWTD